MRPDKINEEQIRWENHQIGILKSYFESLTLQYGADVTPQHLGRKLREHVALLETEGKSGILSTVEHSLKTDDTGNHISKGSVVTVEGFEYDPEKFELLTPYSNKVLDFTKTEGKIFHPLILNPGRFVTNSRLSDLAWNYDSVESGLIKTHMTHIRAKLTRVQELAKVEPFQHIVTKTSVGYSFVPKRI